MTQNLSQKALIPNHYTVMVESVISSCIIYRLDKLDAPTIDTVYCSASSKACKPVTKEMC